jgi:multidrug resistance efflux pump
MSEETKPWRAHQPLGELDRVAFAKMVIRANAELDAKDARIAELEAEIAQLRAEREFLLTGTPPEPIE